MGTAALFYLSSEFLSDGCGWKGKICILMVDSHQNVSRLCSGLTQSFAQVRGHLLLDLLLSAWHPFEENSLDENIAGWAV